MYNRNLIDIVKPVCPGTHNHRHIRKLFRQFGKAGVSERGNFYVTITDGDPCSWRVVIDK